MIGRASKSQINCQNYYFIIKNWREIQNTSHYTNVLHRKVIVVALLGDGGGVGHVGNAVYGMIPPQKDRFSFFVFGKSYFLSSFISGWISRLLL